PEERRRPPEAVDVEDFLRNRDLGVLGDLLADELHREERREIVRPDGLPGAGVEHRLGSHGHVGADVVPAPRQLRLVEEELGLRACSRLLHGRSLLLSRRAALADDLAKGDNYVPIARIALRVNSRLAAST